MANVKAFEEQLLKNKEAKRRNLTLFLYETGAISSIHAALNLFHKMHNAGVNILLVLPTFLSSVVDELLEVPPPQTNKSHHQSINEISRKFVQRILKERNIAVLKISNKLYIPEKLEVFGDSFVYFDKNEKMLSHFLEIKDKINSNCIPLDHLMYDEKEKWDKITKIKLHMLEHIWHMKLEEANFSSVKFNPSLEFLHFAI